MKRQPQAVQRTAVPFGAAVPALATARARSAWLS